jgi:hypothetical protein
VGLVLFSDREGAAMMAPLLSQLPDPPFWLLEGPPQGGLFCARGIAKLKSAVERAVTELTERFNDTASEPPPCSSLRHCTDDEVPEEIFLRRLP